MREEAIPASFFVWEQARRARDGAQIHFCRLVRCNPGLFWEQPLARLKELQATAEVRGSANRPSPQSPKGILGSPPPRASKVQTMDHS